MPGSDFSATGEARTQQGDESLQRHINAAAGRLFRIFCKRGDRKIFLCLHWAAECGIIRGVSPEWAFVALTGDEDFNRGKMKKGNEQID